MQTLEDIIRPNVNGTIYHDMPLIYTVLPLRYAEFINQESTILMLDREKIAPKLVSPHHPALSPTHRPAPLGAYTASWANDRLRPSPKAQSQHAASIPRARFAVRGQSPHGRESDVRRRPRRGGEGKERRSRWQGDEAVLLPSLERGEL